jgi:hypothetical protein
MNHDLGENPTRFRYEQTRRTVFYVTDVIDKALKICVSRKFKYIL